MNVSDTQVSIIAIQVILTLAFIIHVRMFSDITAKHRDELTKLAEAQMDMKTDIALMTDLVENKTAANADEHKPAAVHNGSKNKKQS